MLQDSVPVGSYNDPFLSSVCVKLLYVKFVCVKLLFVRDGMWQSCVCVWVCVKLLYYVRGEAAGGGAAGKRPGIQNQKQEPHTKLWGTNLGQGLPQTKSWAPCKRTFSFLLDVHLHGT